MKPNLTFYFCLKFLMLNILFCFIFFYFFCKISLKLNFILQKLRHLATQYTFCKDNGLITSNFKVIKSFFKNLRVNTERKRAQFIECANNVLEPQTDERGIQKIVIFFEYKSYFFDKKYFFKGKLIVI